MSDSLGSYIEKISENVLEASFSNFDQALLENAKKRIIDLTGCLICGAYAPGNLALVNLVKSWGGNKESTILIHGGKVPAHNAAMLNSIMARSFDYEAVGAYVEGVELASHISGTTVMTALTLGEARDIDGKELITALLIGDDIACRLLASSGFGFTLGWDGNGTVNAFGATAIAGRLLGLTKKQMQNAFGIVLNQLGGSFQNIWDGTLCFKLPQGLSARNGIVSAELSKSGWNGPKDALFSKFGYFHLFTEGCNNPDILIKDLGKKYYTEGTLKPYPCCRANHAAIDCAIDIVNKHNLCFKNLQEADQVDEIILTVPSRVRNMFVGQPFEIRDILQADAAFNIRYCVANVLVRGSISLQHFQEEEIKDPLVKKIADKIAVKEFEDFEQKKISASLKIIMGNDEALYAEVDVPRGNPVHKPLSKEEIKDKFFSNVEFSRTISRKKAEEIINLIENLEKVDHIIKLSSLLVT